jgi:hypothetical protein
MKIPKGKSLFIKHRMAVNTIVKRKKKDKTPKEDLTRNFTES